TDPTQHEAEAEHAGRPAGKSTALKPYREPDRAAQGPAGPRRTGPLGQQAVAMVAACPEPGGHRDTPGEQGDRWRQRPPEIAAERAHLLAPADRRQPGRPGRDGPQPARVGVPPPRA